MERPVKYLLGIDQGATQTTAVVVNELGEMIEKNSAQLPARISRKKTLTTDASRAKTTEFFLMDFSYLLKKAGKRPEGLSFDHIFRGNLRDGVHHPRNIEKIRSIHKKIHANG
jgi:N-acetylglucosamine kinase-like BadF-type ATPase